MPTSASQNLGADVALFVNPENNEQDQHRSLQDIAAKIQSGSSSINDLVGQTVSTNACRRSIMRVQPFGMQIEGLGQSLVSDDETERGRAALLLGEVHCDSALT